MFSKPRQIILSSRPILGKQGIESHRETNLICLPSRRKSRKQALAWKSHVRHPYPIDFYNFFANVQAIYGTFRIYLDCRSWNWLGVGFPRFVGLCWSHFAVENSPSGVNCFFFLLRALKWKWISICNIVVNMYGGLENNIHWNMNYFKYWLLKNTNLLILVCCLNIKCAICILYLIDDFLENHLEL